MAMVDGWLCGLLDLTSGGTDVVAIGIALAGAAILAMAVWAAHQTESVGGFVGFVVLGLILSGLVWGLAYVIGTKC